MSDALTGLEDLTDWDAEAALLSAQATPTATTAVVATLEAALPTVIDTMVSIALHDDRGRVRLDAAVELVRLALELNVLSSSRELEDFVHHVRG